MNYFQMAKKENMNRWEKQWNMKKKSNIWLFCFYDLIILITKCESSYRLNFEKLKNLKTQIEHAQHLIEKSQVKIQKDFENWWQEQCEIIVISLVLVLIWLD